MTSYTYHFYHVTENAVFFQVRVEDLDSEVVSSEDEAETIVYFELPLGEDVNEFLEEVEVSFALN